MKDQRYYAVKSLIETKRLTSLAEIFKIIPISVVRIGIKANYNTFRKRVYNGDTLTTKDFRLMAELFEVEPGELLQLAINDVLEKGTKKMIPGSKKISE